MIIRNNRPGKSKASQLAMTPMIDIVFQLLVFFILTFKVIPQEGDLNMNGAVLAAEEPPAVEEKPLPLRLVLTADEAGDLAVIRLNMRPCASLEELQKQVIGYLGDDRGPGSLQAETNMVIVADSRLKYSHVIDAVTAVSGYKKEGKTIPLIENLRMQASTDPQ